MNKADQTELLRLTEQLRKVNDQIASDSASTEAIEKAAIALILMFLRGLRREIEEWHKNRDAPLSDVARQHLLDLGIDPDL
jgi:hypothetical protein